MFSHDILKIIISYTPPLSLHPLFNMYDINPSIKFKYDASRIYMSYEKFNYIFNNFTNIIITGIYANSIDDLKYKKHDPHVIKRLIINCHNGWRGSNINLLEHYKNVRHFEMSGYYFSYHLLDKFDCFETLRTIGFSYSVHEQASNWLKKCINLHHITLENYSINKININVLDKMNKLRTVCINNCNDFDGGKNKFNKIKKLTIKNCANVSMSNFGRCNKLKRVSLIGYIASINIRNYMECKQVHHWYFENVTGIWDFRGGAKTIKVFRCDFGPILNFKWDLTKLLISNSKFEVLELGAVNNLEIVSCTKFHKMSVQKATSIRISDCDRLQDMPICGETQKLELCSCPNLTKLSSLGECKGLTDLRFSGCREIVYVKEIGKCQDLETLEFAFCVKLRNLIGLEKCMKLKHVSFEGCTSVTKADPLIDHNSLERIGLCQHHRLKMYYVEMLKDKIYEIYRTPGFPL